MKRYLLFTLLFIFTSNHFTKKLHDVLNVIENVVYYNNKNNKIKLNTNIFYKK